MPDDDKAALPYDEWRVAIDDGDFEGSLAALKDVVSRLEAGNLRLDDAVQCYEVGTLLARHCERLLDQAELRIARLDQIDEPSDE